MFPLAFILGVALFRGDFDVWRDALPIAGAGGLVALLHVLLYYELLPPSIEPCAVGPSCSGAAMAFAGLPLPPLSALAFITIVFALWAVVPKRSS